MNRVFIKFVLAHFMVFKTTVFFFNFSKSLNGTLKLKKVSDDLILYFERNDKNSERGHYETIESMEDVKFCSLVVNMTDYLSVFLHESVW
jgi:hypothetical protein